MTEIRRLGTGRALQLAEGVEAYPLFGEGAMLNMVRLAPHAEVALHSHPHEQLGVVLAGSLTMTFDGELSELEVDDAYAIAGGVEHSARAGAQGCTVLDVFRPVREDYRALDAGG